MVGIGTNIPGSAFEVFGAGAVANVKADGATNARVRITSGNAQSSFLEFGDSDDTDVGEIVYDHSDNHMHFTTNTSERLRITSDGDIRGSLLESSSGVSVYPEFYRRITGFTGGSSVVQYILLCTTSQPNVRLSGRLVTSRSPGTSAVSSQLFDVTFQTNHDGTHRSGAIMGLHSGSDGYDHAQAEFVSLT